MRACGGYGNRRSRTTHRLHPGVQRLAHRVLLRGAEPPPWCGHLTAGGAGRGSQGRVLWASDYPHPYSTWPHSRQAMEKQMGDLSPEVRR
jgi:hypothetical protein